MKTSLSLCPILLLLFLIISQVQGIRLEKEFSLASYQKIQVEEEDPPIGEVKVTNCRDGHCSSGINRKLMTKTTSTSTTTTTTPTTTTTNSKNMKNGDKSRDEVAGREEENFIVNASPVSEHPEAAPEGYPDIIDIAGMDYSPARRKPPIHN